MSLTYEDARRQLHAWTETPSLLLHARAIEIVMRQAASQYGSGTADEETSADEEAWAVTGLLHDADYERWPEEHPQRTVAWLRERGEEEIAHAVSAHFTQWGVAHESPLDKALLACDELTGFIVACCLVRPEGVATLKPKSVKKKLKTKAFAAAVSREDVENGAEILGLPLPDHITNCITALQGIAAELELLPAEQPSGDA